MMVNDIALLRELDSLPSTFCSVSYFRYGRPSGLTAEQLVHAPTQLELNGLQIGPVVVKEYLEHMASVKLDGVVFLRASKEAPPDA